MVIRLIKKMPRRESISGGLSAEEYRDLKAGKDTEVNGAAAQHLIAGGYAETVEINGAAVQHSIEIVDEIKTDNEEE